MSEIHRASVEAQRFFTERQAELHANRESVLGACAVHLAWTYVITNTAAMQVAMNVLSEIESLGVEAFIDLERSNSRMVLLRDTAERRVHMVSVADLMRLVRDRQVHPPAPSG